MTQDVLREAIKKLEEDLGTLIAEVKKKRAAINVLHETIGEQPPYEIEEEPKTRQIVRPDQFYGKGFATAAQEFLQIKKQACSAEEITRGLEEGGFDFPWNPNDRLRSVAISLAKNSTVFHKLPNNTFGLLIWYPNIQQKKAEIQKKDAKAENANEETSKEETKEEIVGTSSDDKEKPRLGRLHRQG